MSDVEEKNTNRTNIHIAAWTNNIECVKNHLDDGVNINIDYRNNVDGKGSATTPLHFAATHGAIKVMNLLILRKAEINLSDINGNSPLHFCAMAMDTQVAAARTLLNAKADVNQVNNGKSSALMLAADEGFAEMIRLLVEYQADVNLQNKNGFTAADILIDAHANAFEEEIELLQKARKLQDAEM